VNLEDEMRASLGRGALMLALVGAGLAGCVGAGSPAAGPGVRWADSSLRASLLPEQGSTGRMSFHVSRPAYVAVFRIVPGQGTALVYPGPGGGFMDGRVFPGLHGFSATRAWVGARPVTRSTGPEFYFMVASERPLMTSNLGPYGSRLNSAMGFRFASHSAHATMEQLVTLVVPDLSSADWTTDFYVHWPQTLHASPRSGFVAVQCGGLVTYTHPQMARAVREQLCRVAGQDPAADPVTPVPGDTAGVVEPRRRPPVDVGERISSTQLSDPARWERMRTAVDEGRPIDVIERGNSGPGASPGGAVERRPAATADRLAPARGRAETGVGGSSGAAASTTRERPVPAADTGERAGARERPSTDAGTGVSSGSAREPDRREPPAPREVDRSPPSPTDGGARDPME
jgi:hypothetical protein